MVLSRGLTVNVFLQFWKMLDWKMVLTSTQSGHQVWILCKWCKMMRFNFTILFNVFSEFWMLQCSIHFHLLKLTLGDEHLLHVFISKLPHSIWSIVLFLLLSDISASLLSLLSWSFILNFRSWELISIFHHLTYCAWIFHCFCQHTRNPSCTNLSVLENIDNVGPTFLLNAKLDSSFPSSDLLCS